MVFVIGASAAGQMFGGELRSWRTSSLGEKQTVGCEAVVSLLLSPAFVKTLKTSVKPLPTLVSTSSRATNSQEQSFCSFIHCTTARSEARSEERRVGRECRGGWAGGQCREEVGSW